MGSLKCEADDTCNVTTTGRTPLDMPLARRQWIDSAVSVKGSIPEVRSGVKFGDGDGTIPVVSLGAMCLKGWKGKTPWNPAGIAVVTQGRWLASFGVCDARADPTEEYKHTPEGLDLRGGALT